MHFFDPNFGHFRFPNRQVFREKLKPFWRYAYMNPAHPEPYFSPRMQIQRILPGPIPEKTFIPGGVFQQKVVFNPRARGLNRRANRDAAVAGSSCAFATLKRVAFCRLLLAFRAAFGSRKESLSSSAALRHPSAREMSGLQDECRAILEPRTPTATVPFYPCRLGFASCICS